MLLRKISLTNFRNYASQEINFSDGINIFTGRNGSGKTNVIEAIHYLCLVKAYFHSGDSGAVKIGEEYFRLEGIFDSEHGDEIISLAYQSGVQKILKHDSISYEKIADHVGKYPVVVIAPDDISLIIEGSEARRRWLDSMIAQVDRIYLDHLIQYNRTLLQRNALLKQWASGFSRDEHLMNILDEQLANFGEKIFEERKKCLRQIVPFIQKKYLFISEERETASLEYESQLIENNFTKSLLIFREKDIATQRTNFGIHRDDLDFLLYDFSLKKFGSQGQKKSFLIALKLAQFDFIRNKKDTAPLLLLDDIFDKLDHDRSMKLLEEVSSKNHSQVFITCTSFDNSFLKKSNRIFNVENGIVQTRTTNQPIT